MDKFERRRLRLIRIRDELCNENVADLARKLEKEPSYVHRMLYPSGKKDKKNIGEDSVDAVLKKFGIDLDEDIARPGEPSMVKQRPSRMQWVSDEESYLLSLYRSAEDDRGRELIVTTAEGVPKALFTGLISHEPQ